MFVIALTGGIGAGKTEAAEYFRSRGAVVVDLDDVAAHILGPGSPLLEQLADEFGSDVVGEDGMLNRGVLAERAFASRESAARLNQIVHPGVVREVGPALTNLQLLPQPPRVVVVSVPLLAEAPVFAEFADDVLAIAAPEDVRIERAVARGLSDEDVRARVACQASDEERAGVADHVVLNDGSIEALHAQLGAYWDEVVSA